MSYGLNVEMHKQTEICKRLDAIIRQVLPFLSAEVKYFAVAFANTLAYIISLLTAPTASGSRGG